LTQRVRKSKEKTGALKPWGERSTGEKAAIIGIPSALLIAGGALGARKLMRPHTSAPSARLYVDAAADPGKALASDIKSLGNMVGKGEEKLLRAQQTGKIGQGEFQSRMKQLGDFQAKAEQGLHQGKSWSISDFENIVTGLGKTKLSSVWPEPMSRLAARAAAEMALQSETPLDPYLEKSAISAEPIVGAAKWLGKAVAAPFSKNVAQTATFGQKALLPAAAATAVGVPLVGHGMQVKRNVEARERALGRPLSARERMGTSWGTSMGPRLKRTVSLGVVR
jgi:hypothetical protein